jgi:integrase
MAWIRWRVTRRHGRQAYVQWREAGRVRSERVGTDARAAEAIRREREKREEATAGLASAAGGAALLEGFIAYKRGEGCAAGTLAFYRKHLEPLIAAWRALPVHRWDRHAFDVYLAGHPEWKPRRVGMAVATARTMVRWAAGRGVHVPDFTEGLVQHGTPPASEPALTAAQVRALLDAAKGHRYALPCYLAAYAGLSLGDIRALTWREVDLAGGWIRRPRQKTGAPVLVPILPQLRAELERVRATHGPVVRCLPASDALMYANLRRLYRRAGLPGKGGWHALRHGFGTTLMAGGVHPSIIGRLLAHRPGSPVTARYTRPDDSALVEAMKAVERGLGV